MNILKVVGLISITEHQKQLEKLNKQIAELKEALIREQGLKQSYKILAGRQ